MVHLHVLQVALLGGGVVGEVVNLIIKDVADDEADFDRGLEVLGEDQVEVGQNEEAQDGVAHGDGEHQAEGVLGEGVVDAMQHEVAEEGKAVVGQVLLRVEEEAVEDVLNEGPLEDAKEDSDNSQQGREGVELAKVYHPRDPKYRNRIPRSLSQHF